MTVASVETSREKIAVELYGQGRVEFHELSKLLGLDKVSTGELLQRHRIYRGSLTREDLEQDARTLDTLFKKES